MFREHLEKYWVCVQTLCGIQLVLSVLSMATGAALLVLASSSDSLEWPLNSGVGVWAGFIVSINRVFHALPTTQEWQYCQLCFDHAIQN